jgi:hypothetical protein
MSKTDIQSVAGWLALPEIALPALVGAGEKGSVVMVFKVGFLAVSEVECAKADIRANRGPAGKCLLPTATVNFASVRQLCRLPIALSEWTYGCVNMAMSGRNPFPSDVEFGVLNGRTYAELV